jgi:hypothetical protein
MDYYVPNRRCHCSRCRFRGFMGPAMILTVGVLALLNNFTGFHWHQTWPIFLIVVGIVKVMGSSADTSGHVPPTMPYIPGTVPPQQTPPQPPQGVNNV